MFFFKGLLQVTPSTEQLFAKIHGWLEVEDIDEDHELFLGRDFIWLNNIAVGPMGRITIGTPTELPNPYHAFAKVFVANNWSILRVLFLGRIKAPENEFCIIQPLPEEIFRIIVKMYIWDNFAPILDEQLEILLGDP